ncbi:MAG: cdsA [Parachlamydiales bacterium]|nr:cdsA [Parachlamydiales bacterium]
MLKDLGRRTVASSIAIGGVFVLLYFANVSWVQFFLAVIVAALSAVAAWEYAQFAKAKGGKPKSPALIALSFLVTFSFFISARDVHLQWAPPTMFLLAILILFALHFREQAGAVIDLAVSTFGLLYIALPMGMILGILVFSMADDGRMWVAYLLAVTKMTDMGAYFGGSLWGRRKLAPHISPTKTIEGAGFGLFSALMVSFFFHILGESIPSLNFHLATVEWVSLGIVLGCVGQFGDLSESLLKRDANKKDSNILPGLGGILDAVDSLLFNAPIIYFYLIAAGSTTV